MTLYRRLKCRVCLVREGKPEAVPSVSSPEEAFNLVKEELGSSDRERFVSIMLSTRNRVIGIETVGIGILNACLVTPREVFKAAILANASSIVLCHNHVSGDVNPSPDDITLTKRFIEAGKLMGIEVLDHVIVSSDSFLSLKETHNL